MTQQRFELSSSAYAEGGAMPALYSHDGDNVSPPLRWQGPPDGTHSLALIMDDPDAPFMTWVHWVVYNLPASASELPQAVRASDLPSGAVMGRNGRRKEAYDGPSPPWG